MSQWEARITDHPIHNSINNIIKLIGEIESIENFEKTSFDDLYRVKSIVELTSNSIEGIDPIFIPISILNNINNQFTPAIQQITHFKNNRNKGHIDNANTHMDNVLVQLASLLNTFPTADSKKFIDGITSFRKSAGQHLRNFLDEYNALKNKYNELNSQL